MTRPPNSSDITTTENVEKYETIKPLLAAMFREFQDAGKKKPDAVLNAQKVEMVNRLLKDVLLVLSDEPTLEYIDVLDGDALPQNSDVVLILGQALAAMDAFKSKYYGHIDGLLTFGWATPKNLGLKNKR